MGTTGARKSRQPAHQRSTDIRNPQQFARVTGARDAKALCSRDLQSAN